MDVEEIKLCDIEEVYKKLKENSNLVYETPLIEGVQYQLHGEIPAVKTLALKLESMQCTGSFKIRGALNQFLNLSDEDRKNKRTLVTMSAGNYGKAFAYVAKQQSMPGIVCMPESAPQDRQTIIESYGCQVHRMKVSEIFSKVTEEVKRTNGIFFHPYDDPILIFGNASAGLELTKQISQPPDVVLVCVGGGGFLAGVSTALRLRGWKDTRVYGVEPENSPKLYSAMQAGRVVAFEHKPTIAGGLAPPVTDENNFKLIKKYVDGILLVSDYDLRRAMKTLFNIGLVAEPLGATAFAALLANKVPDVEGKNVAVMVTGGNVTAKDLKRHIQAPQ